MKAKKATIWTVPGTVLRVVDGDTLDVDLDLGWHVTYHVKVRLAGLNCPEMSTPAGPLARDFTENYLWNPLGSSVLVGGSLGAFYPITVVSHSLDKYGRVLATILVDHAEPRNLNLALVDSGHAVPM